MKSTILFRFIFFLGLLGFVASCNTDETDPTSGNPTIEIVAASGFVSGSAALVAPGEPIKVRIRAAKGEGQLNSLTVFQNSIPMELEDITYNGIAASANPILLFNADKDNFTYDIELVAHTQGTVEYIFEVRDEAGNFANVAIDITVGEGLAIKVTGDSVLSASPSAFIAIPVVVETGIAQLFELSVTSGGDFIDPSRLRFLAADVENEFDENPYLIPEAQAAGFAGNIYIQADAAGGEATYVLTISDTDGEVASATVIIRSGTPLDGEYVAIILNNADGQNLGGIDLRDASGDAVTVTALGTTADIVDKGINLALPNATNWYQQILPANGAELRVPDFTKVEGFSYETTVSKEVITEAFNTGISKTESDVIEVGDLFLVKQGDDYFLLKCTNVVVTTADNNDYMEFSIKQAFGN